MTAKVRSFKVFLDKFEKDFGKETLKLARRHKRSWNWLIWLYVRNIPIKVHRQYGAQVCINHLNNNLTISINQKDNPVGILVNLSHEAQHCKDYWNKNRA